MPGAPRRTADVCVAVYNDHAGTGRRRVQRLRPRRTDPDQAAHRRPPLHADQHTYNKLPRELRCLGERGMIS